MSAAASMPSSASSWTVRELQDQIRRLKRERDVLVLAHAYQSQDIIEVADVMGDSYALSVVATDVPQDTVVMCGVRFMAETVKVLSPEKRVLLANPLASCPMAQQLDPETLRAMRASHPGYAIVAYVNTTSALKAEADVCVTSSSAVRICKALPEDKILFVPDPNLGRHVAACIPEKEFAFFDGGCPVHRMVGVEDVRRARATYPDAPLLVHPECPPEVCALADHVGSTSEIMALAKESPAQDVIIGTEGAIVEHLQYAAPQKRFHLLSPCLSCRDMRMTTLVDLYRCLEGSGGEEISLPDDVVAGAGRCIRRMVELGG